MGMYGIIQICLDYIRMAEASYTLIMGALQEDSFWKDKQDILADPTVYFLDRRPSEGPRFIQSDILGMELASASKKCPVKFQHIVVDVGTWHHLLEDGAPNIGAISYMLTPTGKIYVPEELYYNSLSIEISKDRMLREKTNTENVFAKSQRKLEYSLVPYDKNINPAVDLVASRMLRDAEKYFKLGGKEPYDIKFHVGSRVAAGGAKLRSRKSKRKVRKMSRKLRRK
jgi:hypothetical protein